MSSARNTSLTPCPEADDSTSGDFLHAFFKFAVCALIASGVMRVGLRQRDDFWLVDEAVSISSKLVAHGLVIRACVLAGAVDEMQQHAAAFGVAEETVAKADALMRAFDQARQIGQHEFAVVDSHHAELRMQRGEGIVGDLRLGGAHRGEERGLAGIGQADQRRHRRSVSAAAGWCALRRAGRDWRVAARGWWMI